ncbi:MAG: IS4 family transposase [Crocosphaera sp.]
MRDPFGIAAQISALLTPALAKQKKYCRQLGLRDRILTLPLMVAAVLTMLWRDVAGVRELTRMLAREGFLWCDRLQVSQQALSKRFLTFPADLFENVLSEILPSLEEKWHQRNHRPLPESVQFTLTRFEKIWIADGSTLEALFKKLKSLEDVPKGQLAGKIGAVVDLMTRLPVEIWFKENPKTNDTKFEEDLLKIVEASTLLLLDRGFYHFSFWQRLIDRKIHFITRLKKRAAIKVEEVFTESYSLRDRRIRLGSGTKRTPYITLRLIEVKSGKVWHSYLTSVLEPEILPPYVVADLYGKRWRIEEAFNTVKRLLGLSYLWVGSINGVKLQIWGTWLFYAILIDLGDAVADELSLPFDRISLEMIYRGLYHFGVANQKGEAKDPVSYFSAPENKDLGIVKQLRKNKTKLIVAPFPEKQRNTPEFFFSAKSVTYA